MTKRVVASVPVIKKFVESFTLQIPTFFLLIINFVFQNCRIHSPCFDELFIRQCNMLERKPLQSIELFFLEGAQFNHMSTYFLALVSHLDLIVFLQFSGEAHRTQTSLKQKGKASRLSFTQKDRQKVRLVEIRNEKDHEILYWVEEQGKDLREMCDFSLELKSEVEIISQEVKSRNIIKIIIKRFWEPPAYITLFQSLKKIQNGKFLYKRIFCKYNSIDQIEYPSTRFIPRNQKEEGQNNKKNIVLLINQSNLRQFSFFGSAIESIMKENRVRKIIGHPCSLLLALLIDPNGKFDKTIENLLLNSSQKTSSQSLRLHTVTREQIVKSILFRMFSQQNLLNPTLIQFLIDNIVETQFVSDFVKLIQLYYRIFLNQDIKVDEVQAAIEHYFYQEQQNLQRYAFSFSCLFNFVQWKHSLQSNRLLQSLQIIGNKLSIKVQDLTLKDLYRYNGVQFTFIGFDLTDKIVRFFNCSTTPNMPIAPLLALVQFFPMPYKSIYWRQQWGKYRIHYNETVRQISLTQHQIVDTRFLLESPLDILSDKSLRNCYMQPEQDQILHVISFVRKKTKDLPQMEDLKALLKSMKSKAIDAIPKFKLIWKIITTKNNLQIDLNNFQTFKQIPIISRFVNLDQTLKAFLDNLNRQANRNRTVRSITPLVVAPELVTSRMTANLNQITFLLSDFSKDNDFEQKSMKEFQSDMEAIEKYVNQYNVKSYDEYVYIKSKVSSIINIYQLEGKYKYKSQLQAITQKLNEHSILVDISALDLMIKELISSLKNAKQKKRRLLESNVNSSSFMRDTYTPINGLERVTEKLSSLLSDLKAEIKTFRSLEKRSLQSDIFAQYQKIVYRFCKSLQKILERVSESKKMHQFFYEINQITPHLYQLLRMEANQMIYRQDVKSIFQSCNFKKIHLVLNGQPHILVPLGKQLIRIRDTLKQVKITSITSTNYHSIAALLFALGLDDETFIEQLLGLQQAPKTHTEDDEKIDLVEMLLRSGQRDDHGQQEREANEQLYLKIAKKYQRAFKLLIQLEDTTKQTKRLNIHKLYQLINQYDKEHESTPNQFKETEILEFLEGLLMMQKQSLQNAALIRENREMIEEKMKLNKVGIKFMIRFLYRNQERETNWLSIHLRKYKSLKSYQKQLCQLFFKYNLQLDMTLSEFNSTNSMGIQLSFVLINYHRNRYQFFNSQQRGYVRLIDLLIAAASVPLDFPTKMISIRQRDSKGLIEMLLKKDNKKFNQAFRDEAYWSNYSCNSIPFHLIPHQNDTFIGALEFKDEFVSSPSTLNHKSLQRRQSMRTGNDQKNNLRAFDLLSMWWTKSKKLTPQMKEILFGSIFESPFLYYYYILQNSSYEALREQKTLRSLINLNENEEHLKIKGSILGQFYSQKKADNAYLKITTGKQLSVEIIAIRPNLQIKLQADSILLIQGQQQYIQKKEKKILEADQQLNLNLYCFSDKRLQKYDISFTLPSNQSGIKYYEIAIKDNNVTLCEINPLSNIIPNNSLPLNTKVTFYNLLKCSCKGEENRDEGSTCSTCQKSEEKRKRGNLNLYLLVHESIKSDFQEFKCKVIEEVRQSVILAPRQEEPPKRNFLSLFCCCRNSPE